MTARRLVAALSMLLAIGAAHAEVGLDPAAEALVEHVFDALDARRRGCAAPRVSPGGIPVLGCGRVPKALRGDAERLAERIDDAVAEAGGVPAAEWEIGEKWHRRGFRVGDTLQLEIAVDRRGRVRTRYPAQFPPCLRADAPAMGDPTEDGVEPPVLIPETRVQPYYPEAARAEKADGLAQLEAVVRPDGTVAEACVQYEHPRGLGFGQEAVKAVSRWRYEPARRDGQPIEWRMTFTMNWSVGGP